MQVHTCKSDSINVQSDSISTFTLHGHFWQAAAREEEVCRQTAALKKTEYTLGAVKAELERGLAAREAAKTRIAGADLFLCSVHPDSCFCSP